MKELNVGDAVIFIDENRVDRPAVVTKVWSSAGGLPGCNLVFVSGDDTKDDPYGRQIERRTSIVHISQQPARGFAWRHPDEQV